MLCKCIVFILLIVFSSLCNAGIVIGRVCDDLGYPLVGASVDVRNTLIHTLTDFNGFYQVNIPSEGYYRIKVTFDSLHLLSDSLINVTKYSETEYNFGILPNSEVELGTGSIRGMVMYQIPHQNIYPEYENGVPLLGGVVMVVGTTSGAITDNQGGFHISDLRPGWYILEASCIIILERRSTSILVTEGSETEYNFLNLESIPGSDTVITIE